jgi:hypothetical protein
MNTSRQKGLRVERLVRDEFRKLGYQSDRIPLSGAMKGYQGDVKFSKDGETLIAEVKYRKDAFKTIYAFLDSKLGSVSLNLGEKLCRVSYSLEYVLYTRNPHDIYYSGESIQGRFLTMYKWVKGANVLCIKNARKPFIYIAYL